MQVHDASERDGMVRPSVSLPSIAKGSRSSNDNVPNKSRSSVDAVETAVCRASANCDACNGVDTNIYARDKLYGTPYTSPDSDDGDIVVCGVPGTYCTVNDPIHISSLRRRTPCVLNQIEGR